MKDLVNQNTASGGNFNTRCYNQHNSIKTFGFGARAELLQCSAK